MSNLPTYQIEAPDQDQDLAQQLIDTQRQGLELVLRDLGVEIGRHLTSQEQALQKVTNALKRKINTQLRGQVKALIPVMDAIHGRVASSLAEQQVALSTLMDQPAFQCVKGVPTQDPSGKWGCYYDGAVHFDSPETGQVAGMPLYPDTVGPSPAPATTAAGTAPATTAPAVAPPGTYPVPSPAGGAGEQPSPGGLTSPPAMCCPPCPAPAPSSPTAGGPDSGASTGGAGGAGGDFTSPPGTTGAAGAGSQAPCPAALGYALSDCGLNVWREGASGLLSSELVQSMLASPDWRSQLMPGLDGPADQPLFPPDQDPLAVGEGAGGLGFLDTGGKQ